MLLSGLFLFASATLASPAVRAADPTPLNRTCTAGSKEQRKGWHKMTNEEKTAYIEADKCLMSLPSKTDFPAAKSRWDDLMYVHINQTNVIHCVGGFLPWHRYFVNLHHELQVRECNYTGGQAYWEEQLDTYPNLLEDSVVFDPVYGFGGNGVGDKLCVQDGPFANTTLHYGPGYEINDLCLVRNFSETSFQRANQTVLDNVYAAENYSTAWLLMNGDPHAAGHLGVGGSVGNGTMLSQSCSPGDPIFYLHHANLDRIWWTWQSMDLDARLTDMDGSNRPEAWFINGYHLGWPTDAWYDYDGDKGNVTTLNHTLSALDVYPNVTVGDVMDIGAGILCYEYV